MSKVKIACPFLLENDDVIILVFEPMINLIQLVCDIPDYRFKYFERYSEEDKIESFRASVIFYPLFVPQRIHFGLGCFASNSCFYLGDKYKRNETKKTIVYLHRSEDLIKRFVENLEEVVDVFKNLREVEFIVLDPSNYINDSLIIEKADVIVGPHGGALSNMIFASENTVVIEFNPVSDFPKLRNSVRVCFTCLANSLGLEYYFVKTKKFDYNVGGMIVDTKDLKRVLYSIGYKPK